MLMVSLMTTSNMFYSASKGESKHIEQELWGRFSSGLYLVSVLTHRKPPHKLHSVYRQDPSFVLQRDGCKVAISPNK